MKILAGLVLALSSSLFAGKEEGKEGVITFEGITVSEPVSVISLFESKEVADEWTLDLDSQSNPDKCGSNRFEWNGSNFICLQVDRLNIIRAQRDYHYATEQWYRLQVIAKDAYSILDELQRIAREKCHKKGKRFSEQDADCAGSIESLTAKGEIK